MGAMLVHINIHGVLGYSIFVLAFFFVFVMGVMLVHTFIHEVLGCSIFVFAFCFDFFVFNVFKGQVSVLRVALRTRASPALGRGGGPFRFYFVLVFVIVWAGGLVLISYIQVRVREKSYICWKRFGPLTSER